MLVNDEEGKIYGVLFVAIVIPIATAIYNEQNQKVDPEQYGNYISCAVVIQKFEVCWIAVFCFLEKSDVSS